MNQIVELYPDWFFEKLKQKFDNYEIKLDTTSNYCCILIETRPLENIDLIIKNHIHYFSTTVCVPIDLKIYTTTTTAMFFKDRLKNIGVSFEILDEKFDFNNLVTSGSFWKKLLVYNKVLFFQWDSLLLRSIDSYFVCKYDYIGAPWPKNHIDLIGGNGGLSIRNPMIMNAICHYYVYNRKEHGNEDLFFSRFTTNNQKLLNIEASKIFVETVFSQSPFGIHAAYKYLSQQQYHHILRNSEINN